MPTLYSRRELTSLLVALAPAASLRAQDGEGWIPLFDGKTLAGWKASEHAGSWKVVDGCLSADGPRSHLFYNGPVGGADFKNFELKADVMTRPGANSGIYFHTRFQQNDWPAQGFEVQVNNTHRGEGSYREHKKTGSLYGVRNVYKQLVSDDQWFQMHILVRGKQVQIRVNGTLVVDYLEPDPPVTDPEGPARVLGRGTFALQGHDAGSKVRYRNIRVKPLPASAAAQGLEPPVVDDLYRRILHLNASNYPIVDYHVHLKGGLAIEQGLANSRRTGIAYGIAVNCGLGFPISSDAGVREFITSMKGQPVFLALQGEGREWVKLVSKEAVAQFDYVFTDAMTFTDDRGKRMRLWIKEEVGEIPDKQAFMETYVNRILGVINHEPIDIYVNPTFLPDVLAAEYDTLWTPERMQKVIDAAVASGVAIEINARYRLPSASFIKLAKKAGAKFSFGTNNGEAELGRLEYALAMVDECGLKSEDIFLPKPDGEKPVQKRGL
ncbi:MAG TPA: family 16 glycoside hydrolase [Bryobacteraceae bacterium]|nr:family 16 glycoside hydrolase [Bryobacteraceae bacterium]